MPIINEPRIRPASSAEPAEDVASRATQAEREGRWDAAAELYALTFRSALGGAPVTHTALLTVKLKR